ncbi:GNAT family N-acetyltransferase [Chelatococcus sp. SYSU_G07232]|uniref:GNAT family N-acetyltransferase n=1 Tax=Chelatococcus albus TaxID=3047466 RepID=A0ABT7AHN4_9HYPH|nr:GNAT family N-acetyltransferase [Chelatococcus sp. SYSU_G07232]MDJ1158895.1 GNAT family N-acetyltransferase [Chelatococcus sp. SYSU_G07232]
MTAIRPAAEADLPAILAIHNHHIAHTLAIWRYEPADLAERRAWFAGRETQGFPVLVAEEAGEIAGFASFGDFRAGAGYHRTVEHSIYVREDRQRRGIARRLMLALFDEARAAGKHVMVAAIGLPNDASVALHASLGFEEAGRLRGIGWKFDRALDLLMMQKAL